MTTRVLTVHSRRRFRVMLVMCILSAYSWFADTMFGRMDEGGYVSLASINCLIFICFISWDVYQMTLSTNHAVLYRTDLMAHHVIALASYALMVQRIPLLGSRILIGECLSLMNSHLNDKHLRRYRMFVLLAMRFPMWIYFAFYYNIALYVSNATYHRVSGVFFSSCLFAIGYDSVVLWKCVNADKTKVVKAS